MHDPKSMKTLYFTVNLLLLFITSSEGVGMRLIGGFEAPAGYASYHASLQNLTGHHVCGGALVSKDLIVTAAHCLIGVTPEYVKIVLGTSNLDHGGVDYEVKSITIHEGYNTETRVHDIALIKTKIPVKLCNEVQIVDLYENDLNESDRLILTGFGALEANGAYSRKMQVLELEVFSQETCQYAMRYTREVYDSMFCTFTRLGEGTCHGDSGGPLVKDGMLAGLVSWGIPCAVGFPDVHTRIKPHFDWIREKNISFSN